MVALTAGCGGKKKEITSLQRKQAAALVSEAEFAVTIRDHARAEGLFAQAVELTPDAGELWLRLGWSRMKQGNRDGAKKAYQAALAALQSAAKEKKDDPEPQLQQASVLALLGRSDEARELVEKLGQRFPENRAVRAFVEQKTLDRMLADPQFKELAL